MAVTKGKTEGRTGEVTEGMTGEVVGRHRTTILSATGYSYSSTRNNEWLYVLKHTQHPVDAQDVL